jgi:heme exporter protein A
MLTCFNLTFPCDPQTQCFGLGFSLLPGSLLIVSGPGKSQLLDIMAAGTKPHRGSVIFDGKLATRSKDYRASIHHIGPANSLNPDMTLAQNLIHAAKQNGEVELVDAAMRYFQLERWADVPFGTLRPESQRRAVLSRLLSMPRPIWLLEEPGHSLEEESKALLYALIANRCNQDGIVVMTTNNPGCITPAMQIDTADYLEPRQATSYHVLDFFCNLRRCN